VEVARAGAVRGERSASPRPGSLARSELGSGSGAGGALDAAAGSIRAALVSRWIGRYPGSDAVACPLRRCRRGELLRLGLIVALG
jgi:hypothetical protein